VPIISGGAGGPAGKPPWLKLEQGEVFVRAYGTPVARPRRNIAAIAIGLLVAFGFGILNFVQFGKSQAPAAASQPDSPVPWIAIAVGAIVVLNLVVLVAVAAARKRKAAAYLTTRMLIVKSGRDYAGVRLSDITAIQRGSGTEQQMLIVRARTANQPVALLPVADPDVALAELTAYSKAAGAKLQ